MDSVLVQHESLPSARDRIPTGPAAPWLQAALGSNADLSHWICSDRLAIAVHRLGVTQAEFQAITAPPILKWICSDKFMIVGHVPI